MQVFATELFLFHPFFSHIPCLGKLPPAVLQLKEEVYNKNECELAAGLFREELELTGSWLTFTPHETDFYLFFFSSVLPHGWPWVSFLPHVRTSLPDRAFHTRSESQYPVTVELYSFTKDDRRILRFRISFMPSRVHTLRVSSCEFVSGSQEVPAKKNTTLSWMSYCM